MMGKASQKVFTLTTLAIICCSLIICLVLLVTEKREVKELKKEVCSLNQQIIEQKEVIKSDTVEQDSYNEYTIGFDFVYSEKPHAEGSLDLDPSVDVYLKIQDRRGMISLVSKIGTYVGAAQIIDSELYNDREYKANTILACLTWYGGTGTDICVVKEDDEIIVYEKNASETEGLYKDDTYQFEEKLVIQINSIGKVEVDKSKLNKMNMKLEQVNNDLLRSLDEIIALNEEFSNENKRLQEENDELITQLNNNSMGSNEDINPIDSYFDGGISGPTNEMTKYAALYLECWKEEYNNVISILLELGHDNIKYSIEKYHSSIEDFSTSKANIIVAMDYSNAFEEGSHGSGSLVYGTLSRPSRLYEIIDEYRRDTLELIDYLPSYEYVFDNENFSNEEKELHSKTKIVSD